MEIPPVYASRIQVAADGCWVWRGWIKGIRGTTGASAPYPVLQINKKRIAAHRHFYLLATGEAPGENCVHHKCHNTLCVNPDHLELLPRAEHTSLHNPDNSGLQRLRSRETCTHGHPWTEATTYWYKGGRTCRICARDTMRCLREAKGLTGKPKVACPHGHPYDAENTAFTKFGHRRCKECNRQTYYKRKERLKTEQP